MRAILLGLLTALAQWAARRGRPLSLAWVRHWLAPDLQCLGLHVSHDAAAVVVTADVITAPVIADRLTVRVIDGQVVGVAVHGLDLAGTGAASALAGPPRDLGRWADFLATVVAIDVDLGGDNGPVELSGQLNRSDARWALTGAAGPVTRDALLAAWPTTWLPHTRARYQTLVRTARLDAVRLAVTIDPLAPDWSAMTFELSASVVTLDPGFGLPTIDLPAATLAGDFNRLAASAAAGTVGAFTLAKLSADIGGPFAPESDVTLRATVEGPMAGLNNLPAVTSIGGRVRARVRLALAVPESADARLIDYAAAATLRDSVLASEGAIDIDLRRSDVGMPCVSLRADHVDARSLLDRIGRSGTDTASGDVDIDASIAHVRLSNDADADGLALRIAWRGGAIEQLDAQAQLKGLPLTARIWRDGGHRQLTLTSANARAVMAHVGLSGLRGGQLSITGQFVGEGPAAPIDAVARLTDFRMVGVSAVAEALAAMSLSGIVGTLVGDGIPFDRAKGDVRLERGRLWLKPVYAHGPFLGLRVDGWIDLSERSLSLNGTVSPAYGFAKALTALPILGRLFERPPGEGAFGFGFQASGSITQPKIVVLPMAPLSPKDVAALFDIR